MTHSPKHPIPFITALVLWAFTMLAIRFIDAIPMPLVQENALLVTAILQVYVPVIWGLNKGHRLDYWVLPKDKIPLTLKWFLICAVLFYPIIAIGNHFYQDWVFGYSFQVKGHMKDFVMYMLTHIIVVAFPEEFFFRGFMTDAFRQKFKSRFLVFGVNFSKADIAVCLLFAFSHSLISLQWWHVFIFFPALVFAWLRHKTGSIWASVLFHGFSNVLAYGFASYYY